MSEWCECKAAKSTYAALGIREGLNGLGVPWVHSTCRKPTYEVWKYHEKFCDECGRSFSSPYINVCSRCSTERPWLGWAWGWQHDQTVKQWRDFSDRPPF